MELWILFILVVLAYLYFYIGSRQYLRREYFEAPLSQAYVGQNAAGAVSWPGGVVSHPYRI
jgi:hypothetical protein